MNDKLKALLQSRRFWAALVGVAAVVSEDLFGVELDQEQLIMIVTVIISWIIGDTFRKTE